MPHPSFEDRIERTSDHWYWTGTIHPKGYGYYNAKRAHRLAYEKYVGPIPEGVIVRHSCDVRHCVRPDHLLLGSPADNSQDMKDRARQARGESHSQVKLTEAAVREIREMLVQGHTQRFIAERMRISQTTVCDIKRGKSWGWFS
jgi:hypothetical protein